MMRTGLVVCGLAAVLMVSTPVASAQQASVLGDTPGARARLEVPASTPRGVLVLLPGGNGRTDIDEMGMIRGLLGNQLVRSRARYVAAGWAVVVVDRGTDLAALTLDLRRRLRGPVVWVGTSRGTLRAAAGLAWAQGAARPDALVLTAGFYDTTTGESVQGTLGTASALPRTLVLHHRRDACRVTPPAAVPAFLAWSGGRARVEWLDGGSAGEGPPCQADSYHGFRGLDGEVAQAVLRFAGQR